jgi:hypothetical protein
MAKRKSTKGQTNVSLAHNKNSAVNKRKSKEN